MHHLISAESIHGDTWRARIRAEHERLGADCPCGNGVTKPITCSSRGVPAGSQEVEQCEEDAVLSVRNDWDDRNDRPPAYCAGCADYRSFWGDRDVRVPNLADGARRLIYGPI